ncbi:hypothetical protein CEXT_13791 [Caerostris extrusa]|uniref:Uncharacterized protein n=1 Tax=Caerostris extrusa TaxID=172846 RepID=A0AAV4SC42_CAEEX|nr:hypothetical protein CEXT_13791 [Caerostris extrusa]
MPWMIGCHKRFRALPHRAIADALVAAKVRDAFNTLIKYIYEDCVTKLLTEEGTLCSQSMEKKFLHFESDFHKFLGKPVGFNPCPDYKSLSELAEVVMKMTTSSLAPSQRLDASKSLLYPPSNSQ